MVTILEDIATVLIIVMAGWISVLFWRAYSQSGASRNILLSAAFAVVCGYKLAQFIFEGLLQVKTLEWMDNEVASEGLIVLLAIVIIIVLAGLGTRRRVGERH